MKIVNTNYSLDNGDKPHSVITEKIERFNLKQKSNCIFEYNSIISKVISKELLNG